MSIVKDVDSAFIAAFKAKDEGKVSALRLLKSGLKNKAIDLIKPELTDEEAVAVIRSEVKKRLDSIEAYKAGNRLDLADKEQSEIDIMNVFLPAQMSDEQLKKLAQTAIDSLPEADRQNFGKAMGAVMKAVKGQADGNAVSRIVKELTA